MADSFHVDPSAMTTASGTFSDISGALQSDGDAAGAVQFMAGNAYYASQGTAYQAGYRQLLSNMLPPMITKITDVSTALTSSGTSYTAQDSSAATGITASGAGA